MLMTTASNSLKICTMILSQELPLQRERLLFSTLNWVRQGENLSPLLFLNDLRGFLHMHKAPGLTCNTKIDDHFMVYIKLFVLLFADDTVISSNNCDDLQTTLNVFGKYCNEWKLTVNTSKTKIVIFSGGRAKQDQTFYFNGEQIEVLNDHNFDKRALSTYMSVVVNKGIDTCIFTQSQAMNLIDRRV